MNIIEKKVSDLIPYANNPRHNEDAVDVVAASIREFGFKVPMVIDSNNVVVAGHTRLLAAKSLGMDVVPCVVADDLTEEQIKAFRLADNKTAEKATWDFEKLELEMQELTEIDMEQFGFDLPNVEREAEEEEKKTLADRFLVPPFSVINGASGIMSNRKKIWLKKGIKSEIGRGGNLCFNSPDGWKDSHS